MLDHVLLILMLIAEEDLVSFRSKLFHAQFVYHTLFVSLSLKNNHVVPLWMLVCRLQLLVYKPKLPDGAIRSSDRVGHCSLSERSLVKFGYLGYGIVGSICTLDSFFCFYH